MQVDAAGGFEHPLQFDQPGGHHKQVAHSGVSTCALGGEDDIVEGPVECPELFVPLDIDIGERPGVLECGARSLRSDGCVPVLLRVEGWVEVDQVYAVGVDSSEDGEVVAGEDGAVADVAHGVGLRSVGMGWRRPCPPCFRRSR